jgi:hypothetical protein
LDDIFIVTIFFIQVNFPSPTTNTSHSKSNTEDKAILDTGYQKSKSEQGKYKLGSLSLAFIQPTVKSNFLCHNLEFERRSKFEKNKESKGIHRR